MSTIEELRERVLGFYNGSPTAKALIRDLLAALEAEHAAREALRKTLADLASADPFAAHAEADHAMAYEQNARLVDLADDRTALLDVMRRLVAHHDAHCAWANNKEVDEPEGPADARALLAKMEGTK